MKNIFCRAFIYVVIFFTFSCDIEATIENQSIKKGQIQILLNDQIVSYAQKAYSFTDIYNDIDDMEEYGILNFTIKNVGDGILNLTGNPIVKVDRATTAFSVEAQPSRTSLEPNTSVSFSIKFKPTNTSEVIGEFIILNDGESHGDFYFNVYGKGLNPKPIISLTDVNDTKIDISSSYLASPIKLQESKSFMFKIKNVGRKPLLLTGNPKVVLSGSDANCFEVITQPADIVSPEGFSMFEIRFNAGTIAGEKTVYVAIESNDTNIPIYGFIIKTESLDAYAQISVERNGMIINSNTGLVNYNDFFNRMVIGKQYVATFTVINTGSMNLEFNNNESISITSSNASCFSILEYPHETVVPNATTSFSIGFIPNSTENISAKIVLSSNSRENKDYTFVIQGTGIIGNTDSSLASLTVDEGILVPAFSPNITEYQLNIDSSINSCNFLPVCNDTKCTSLYGNSELLDQNVPLTVKIDSESQVKFVVTAEDEINRTTYTVSINSIENFNSADLTSLILSWNSDTEQKFDALEKFENSSKPIYYLPPHVKGIKVLAIGKNNNASIYVNEINVETNVWTESIELNEYVDTEIVVKVLAQDGITEKTFEIICRYYGAVWEKVGNMPISAYNHQVVYFNERFCLGAYDRENNWGYWTSSNGSSWTYQCSFDLETNICSDGAASTIFNNTIYTIGGWIYNSSTYTDEIANTVVTSTNGVFYNGDSATSGLTGGIVESALVAFNNKLYLLGGESSSGIVNTVWTSVDGFSWNKESTPLWESRSGHAATVYDNKIYIAGGAYNDGDSERRDVWSSEDGITWIQETSVAQWTGRNDFTLSATSYGLFLVGGNDGSFLRDVWFSSDGSNWICVTKNAAFSARAGHQACIKDGYLYIFGGTSSWDVTSIDSKSDVWRTYIGE